MSKWKQKIKVIAIADTFAVGAMHVMNQMIASSAVLKNILKPGTGKYYNWKMGNIFYHKSGNGAPLLLIHDLNSFSSGYEWSQLEDQLKKDYTVYTIDLLGCGRSDKPGITYTNYLYVQMITDFIKDVIGEKTNVVATGMSSSFILMTAYSNSELIDKIMMVNPCSLRKLEQNPDKKSKIIRHIMSIPIIGTTIYYMKSGKQNIEYVLTEEYIYNPFRIPTKHIDAYYEAAHYGLGNGKFLMASLDGFYLGVNIRRVLEKIENKIVILYGEKRNNAKEIAEGYRKINPSISVVPMYKSKMLPQLETPEEALTQIDKFFK